MNFVLDGKVIPIEEGGGTQSSGVPSGTIVMWHGETIPDGWALCDGQNGTPDLRNVFPVGAGGEYALGATGGEKEVTLTVEQMPEHSHLIPDDRVGTAITSATRLMYGNAKSCLWSETFSTGGSQPHNNLPPYLALYFIMKL